ncbi:MAG: ATP-dependent DNA helicase RecG, partial [Clostridiales bacterium]|nr:ATP-dependent DNA helicase RecG [Clostridiales bacterium]
MNIKELKGVGDKKAALFERLSIYDTVDLLEFYPRDYEVYERPFLIKELKQSDTGRVIAIDGVVTKKPGIYRAGKYSVAAILIRDIEGRFLKCKWFNMPYIGKSLPLGSR